MNVKTAGSNEMELANKNDNESPGRGHTHEEPHHHVEEEECALENDVRTVYLDQGPGQHKNEIYKHNGIRTSKYSLITFLPLNLFT